MADEHEQLVTESELNDQLYGTMEGSPGPRANPNSQQFTGATGAIKGMWTPADAARQEQIRGDITKANTADQAAWNTRKAEHEQFMTRQGPLIDEAKKANMQLGNDVQSFRHEQPTQMPQAPSGPVVDPEEFRKFFGPALVFSMIIGKIAKADMVDGLNMLSGSMQGFVHGSKEKAEWGMQQFKAKMESAVNTEHARLARYRATLESDTLNIQQKMDTIKLDAYLEGDKQMMAAAEHGNYLDHIQNLIKQEEVLQKQKQAASVMWGHLEIAQAKMGAAAEPISQDIIDAVGTYRLAPEKAVQLTKGRREHLIASVTAKYPDYDATQFTSKNAAMRVAGTREANIGFTTEELDGFVRQAVAASQQVSRTGFVPINQLIEMGTNRWSPEQTAFVAANRAVINTFAALSTRSGNSTVHSMQEAEKMLNTAHSPEMYAATAQMLIREGYIAMKAAEKTKQNIMGKKQQAAPSERSRDVDWSSLPP